MGGLGSTLALGNEQPAIQSGADERSANDRSLRILVAEDDGAMRRMLAWSLRRDGHQVVASPDGERLLALLDVLCNEGERPDLIISDVEMPGISGLDVLAAASRPGRRVPVILVTAFGSDEVRERASALGALAVLEKPLDPDRLRSLVRELRGPRSSGRRTFVGLVGAEDESARSWLRNMLSRDGFEVREATSGFETLSLLRYGGPFDLVVADLSWPDRSAIEAARWARQEGITTPFLLVSPYPDEDLRNAVSGIDGVTLVDRRSLDAELRRRRGSVTRRVEARACLAGSREAPP